MAHAQSMPYIIAASCAKKVFNAVSQNSHWKRKVSLSENTVYILAHFLNFWWEVDL